MKDEMLPQIPQQNVPQTQSMYQQLRKTSQKWFTGSHRRIFTNSNLSLSQQSPRQKGIFSQRAIQSKGVGWQDTNDASEKMRVIGVMREQIEIACSEYANRFKGILQDQARKIKLLGDLLVKNQIELDKKNKVIEGLVKVIQEKEESKRNVPFQNINKKVKENEQKMLHLLDAIQGIQQKENGINLKLKSIEKQYRDKLYKISSSYAKKVNELSEEYEERIDKIQKIVTLAQSEPKSNKRMNNDSIINANVGKTIQYLNSELEDLKIEIQSFKRKKYKYQNYKFEQVQNQIEKIYEKLQRYEQTAKLKTSHSPNLKSSQTTHATRTDINIQTKYSQTSKTRFLNKYKSLINTRPDAHLTRQLRKQSCSSQSSSESEVEETLVHDEGNIERLRRIIEEMSIRTPVRIEIDQTGYAKSMDTGMYLVDALGNGFQFSQEEIEQLAAERIIVL